MQNPKELKVTITKNMDRYECWNCHKKAIPIRGYNFLTSGSSRLIAKFCSNRRCNLLWILQIANQRHSELLLKISSWDNQEAYWKLPPLIRSAYREACVSFVNDCYLATALVCRTLIAYAAQAHGSKEKYSFKKHVNYLIDESVVSSIAKASLDKVLDLGGDAAHKLINISEIDTLKHLIVLDLALKEMYAKSDATNMSPANWSVRLIVVALREMCNDTDRFKILAALKDDKSIFQELILKMFENKHCLETVQKLTDKKVKPGTRGVDEILASDSGIACMKYLNSLPELKDLIDRYAT